MRRVPPLLVVLAVACGGPKPDPVISSFAATPATIGAGESAQLSWQTVNGDGCSIDNGVGAVSPAGAVGVSPTTTTTFTLTCGKATAQAAVTVQQKVQVDSFTASPAMVAAGQPVTLTWSAHDATSCSITEVGTVALTGTKVVNPTQTTTWQLTCEGFKGPSFKTATTTVPSNLAPPSGLSVTAGDGKLTLAWMGAAKANVFLGLAAGVTKVNAAQTFTGVTSPLDVTGLTNGTAYFFVATAVVNGEESGFSAEVSGTPVAVSGLGDPYFADQWHLSNTGQRGGVAGEDVRAALAWMQGGRGEGVRVAIVDEGVDFAHEDLASNVSKSLSYDYIGNAPLSYAEHGTCVAGLVAARDDNGVGMRGVAPRANMVSYNLLQDLTVANELDAMTRGKSTNMVSSNSWGDAEDSTGLLSPAEPSWLQGVADGTSTGRGGLGTVYVWAAGNGGDGFHVDNANYDGQTNSRFVFSVGGVGDDGRKVSYSEDGANLLVSAPTMGRANHGLSTTDITGSLGYNTGATPGDSVNASYTDLMDGTSGSTPIVSGVAALVLQAKPTLTWRDVRRVLAYSARKNDAADPGWATNLAGLHVNHKYGFGVVDANSAVTLAKAMTPGAPELSFATALQSPAAAIPDATAAGVASAVVVSGSGIGHVEFIEVTVTISHPRSGDLDLLLDRGGGSPVDVLMVPHSCEKAGAVEQCSAVAGFTFGTLRHMDEAADGAWTLRVADRTPGNTGTLQSWKLTFWGRP